LLWTLLATPTSKRPSWRCLKAAAWSNCRRATSC